MVTKWIHFVNFQPCECSALRDDNSCASPINIRAAIQSLRIFAKVGSCICPGAKP